MDENRKPVKGVEPVDADPAGVPLPPAPPPSRTLYDLAAELTYFTTAPLQVYGGFDRDVVAEYVLHKNPEHVPQIIDCQRPFFQDIPSTLLGRQHAQRVNWNHRLYLVRNEGWDACREFIAAIGLTDQHKKTYTTTGWAPLTIVDPTKLASGCVMDELPTITVIVFAANGSRRLTYLAPAVDPPRTRPYPVHEAPRPEMIQMAEAVFGPPPDPRAPFKKG